MTPDDLVTLIARVLAWQDGTDLADIDRVAASVLVQDDAQQCAEDLGLLPTVGDAA